MLLLCNDGVVLRRAAVPQRNALQQRRISHLSASTPGAGATSPLASLAVGGQPLKRWQREKLEAAFVKGRRHVSVSLWLACKYFGVPPVL
jgi:hypothetical protein